MLRIALFACVVSHAAEIHPTDRILPLIQDGDGWSTTITLVNLESIGARFELLFHTRLMQPWNLAIADATAQPSDGYVRGTLPPNGSITLRTAGTGETANRGYAFLFSPDSARIGVTTALQQTSSGAVLTIPLSPEREDSLRIPFDNTAGASTSLLWLTETPYAMVSYAAVATDGKTLLLGRYQFSAQDSFSQDLFSVAERFPELKDRKGTLILDVTYPNATIYDELFFTAFAIQSLQQGGSSVIPSMSSSTWKANRY